MFRLYRFKPNLTSNQFEKKNFFQLHYEWKRKKITHSNNQNVLMSRVPFTLPSPLPSSYHLESTLKTFFFTLEYKLKEEKKRVVCERSASQFCTHTKSFLGGGGLENTSSVNYLIKRSHFFRHPCTSSFEMNRRFRYPLELVGKWRSCWQVATMHARQYRYV